MSKSLLHSLDGNRFAPTPTGELHLGNMRTALVAYLAARSGGQRFILRMDDLDPQAVKAGAIEQQLDDLEWLGIEFDEGPREGGNFGPYAQSRRFAHYTHVLEQLNDMKLLYPCWCSRKEVIAAAQAPHASDEGPIYPGTCRPQSLKRLVSLDDLPPQNGRAPALRINVSSALQQMDLQTLSYQDLVFGRQQVDPTNDFGDFVVRRRDGIASYQLACAFDDWKMACGLVLRGSDLRLSTGRQLLFFHLMQWQVPQYAHIGLVLDSDGSRLSKRERSISIASMRTHGVEAHDALMVLGGTLNMPNTSDLSIMVNHFALDERLQNPVRLPSQLPWGRYT
jgi:glutamyl-tRNA synthetase